MNEFSPLENSYCSKKLLDGYVKQLIFDLWAEQDSN